MVRLRPTQPFPSCVPLFTPELLSLWRAYLAHTRQMPFQLQPEVSAFVENDFVRMRKADSSVTHEDLHQRLTCARYVMRTHLESCCFVLLLIYLSERLDRQQPVAGAVLAEQDLYK